MFEYILRHVEATALDAVSIFINLCKLYLDMECVSLASQATSREKKRVRDVTYRCIGIEAKMKK